MRIEDLLQRVHGVLRRKTGWLALCRAHADRNPSLSIREGATGILLKCWAGCDLPAICESLDLKLSDLFYDADLPKQRRSTNRQPKPRRFDWRRYAAEREDEALGLWLRGTSILTAARNLDCDDWNDDDFENAFEAVSSAYSDLTQAECFENLAFQVRLTGLKKEKANGL